MKPMGVLEGTGIMTEFYAVRYNGRLGFMSSKPLGLQVLIDFLGSLMWINIKREWLKIHPKIER